MQAPISASGPLPAGDPFQAIRDFCRSYHHHEVQAMLWEWLVTAVSKNNSIYDEGKERGSLIHLYENITLLVAAAYTVHQQNIVPDKTTKAPGKKNKTGSIKP